MRVPRANWRNWRFCETLSFWSVKLILALSLGEFNII
jgi:hypothetical protein